MDKWIEMVEQWISNQGTELTATKSQVRTPIHLLQSGQEGSIIIPRTSSEAHTQTPVEWVDLKCQNDEHNEIYDSHFEFQQKTSQPHVNRGADDKCVSCYQTQYCDVYAKL